MLDRLNDPSYIKKLGNNRTLLGNVGFLCKSHPDVLRESLRLRTAVDEKMRVTDRFGVERETVFQEGYNKFHIPKNDGTFREIRQPAPILKDVQGAIKDVVLSQVPISASAMAGEPGRSFIENAKTHAYNHPRFLINLDLKQAYPSVTSQRIFKNLQAGLSRTINKSFPHIGDDEKQQIIDTLTVLTTVDNELPQGTSTSMRLLNIALTSCDEKILSKIHGNNRTPLYSPQYTRYVDDISISWKEFADMNQVWKNRRQVLNALERFPTEGAYQFATDEIVSQVERLESKVGELEGLSFVIVNRRQKAMLIGLVDQIQIYLNNILELAKEQSDSALVMRINELGGDISSFRKQVEEMKLNDYAGSLKDQVKHILISEGWSVNDKKTHINTPTSSQQKEVTGVTFDKVGKLGIPQRKIVKIQTFLTNALYNPERLDKKYHGNTQLIAEAIIGMRNYILQVRGSLNRNLARDFGRAQQMYYPKGLKGREYELGYSYNGGV